MWEKRGDVIADSNDLVNAIKTMCGIKGVYWLYPVRLKISDDPMIVVSTLSQSSSSEWGGIESASTATFSCDIYTKDPEKLEDLVKEVSENLLLNHVRRVGRVDGRDGVSKRFSVHLTFQASHDVYGRMYRGA